jgi:hypothetical protein
MKNPNPKEKKRKERTEGLGAYLWLTYRCHHHRSLPRRHAESYPNHCGREDSTTCGLRLGLGPEGTTVVPLDGAARGSSRTPMPARGAATAP